jgi:hypothetical protein
LHRASQQGCCRFSLTNDARFLARADKIVRSPLITMDVAVEKAPPVVVEMPNGAHSFERFSCSHLRRADVHALHACAHPCSRAQS